MEVFNMKQEYRSYYEKFGLNVVYYRKIFVIDLVHMNKEKVIYFIFKES